jgi:predicted secreted protein
MKHKKVVIVAHCVLNQNAVVDGLDRARGAYPIIEILLREGLGMLQLPCPELLYSGVKRPPRSFDQYNTREFRELCRSLLVPYIKQLQDYLQNGYTFLGVVAIANSPTCALGGVRGVLMRELASLFEEHNIPLKYAEIPESYQEGVHDATLENDILNLIRSRTV